MRRRDGGGAKPTMKVFWIAVAVVGVGLIAWAAWPEPAVEGRAANFAAFGLDDDPFIGDPDAPVVLVGYESPHCSSCKHFHNNILPGLKADFLDTGKVAYYYIQGTTGGDFDSNVAQECVHREGGNDAFWDLTDRLYARSNTYATPDWNTWLGQIAADHGLDENALLSCFRDEDTASRVHRDWSIGGDHGARGTPTFWVFGAEGEADRVANAGEVRSWLEALTA